jgi:hypothetical protein
LVNVLRTFISKNTPQKLNNWLHEKKPAHLDVVFLEDFPVDAFQCAVLFVYI